MSKKDICIQEWEISEDEVSTIRELHEKRVALENLMRILKKDDDIYDRVVNDYGNTLGLYQNWWDRIKAEYGLVGDNFSLDFGRRIITPAE